MKKNVRIKLFKDNGRYNESAALFNAQYDAFSAAYNRAHLPKGVFVDRREWS